MSDIVQAARNAVNPPTVNRETQIPRVGRKKQIYLDALDIIVDKSHAYSMPTETVKDFECYECEVRFIAKLFNEKEIEVKSNLVRRSKQIRGVE